MLLTKMLCQDLLRLPMLHHTFHFYLVECELTVVPQGISFVLLNAQV